MQAAGVEERRRRSRHAVCIWRDGAGEVGETGRIPGVGGRGNVSFMPIPSP